MIGPVAEPEEPPPDRPPDRPPRPARSESREVLELRAVAARQPELAEAVAMHLEIVELYRRIQGRVPLPSFELGPGAMARHNAEGRPVLQFESIPIELTDLRLMVRQTADVLRRHGALEDGDQEVIQALERDSRILDVVRDWYRREGTVAGSVLDQVLTLAVRPFLLRCAEVLQQRSDLALWTHPHCPLCGSEPDFSVITPAAERHLLCSRCTLRWKFEPLTCPYCRNSDRALVTSFATPDGQYRVYACDVCKRYLKAYDGRRATRPVMPVVDAVATLPLDAAAIQRGYS